MVAGLQDDAQMLIDSVTSLAYYMRGGATFSEIMLMTQGQRDRLHKFIETRLEEESKHPYPVY